MKILMATKWSFLDFGGNCFMIRRTMSLNYKKFVDQRFWGFRTRPNVSNFGAGHKNVKHLVGNGERARRVSMFSNYEQVLYSRIFGHNHWERGIIYSYDSYDPMIFWNQYQCQNREISTWFHCFANVWGQRLTGLLSFAKELQDITYSCFTNVLEFEKSSFFSLICKWYYVH